MVMTVSNQKGGVGKTTTSAALAAGFSMAGKKVLCIDLDPQGNLGFCLGLDTEGGSTILDVLKGDVSNFEDCKKLVEEAINRMNHIDVLVNNAGITKDMLLMRMKPEDFNEVINVNLIGTFNMTKNVINYMMKERKGRIINVSSVVGISGNAGQTNYAASKAGIIGFTKSLAKEVASRNILVNAIAPGFIQTDMTNILKENVKDEIAKTIPLKRMGTAKDVANVVKFLVSEDSSYITGQVIQVDGGMLM